MFLDDTACNLASLNLMKFSTPSAASTSSRFRHAGEVVITAQEIIVDNASYPTPAIARELARLPAARPRLRQPRRAADGARPALRLGRRPRLRRGDHRADVAARPTPSRRGSPAEMGPFAGYEQNREPMLRVMRKHRDAVDEDRRGARAARPAAGRQAVLGRGVELGEQHGFRNARSRCSRRPARSPS